MRLVGNASINKETELISIDHVSPRRPSAPLQRGRSFHSDRKQTPKRISLGRATTYHPRCTLDSKFDAEIRSKQNGRTGFLRQPATKQLGRQEDLVVRSLARDDVIVLPKPMRNRETASCSFKPSMLAKTRLSASSFCSIIIDFHLDTLQCGNIL